MSLLTQFVIYAVPKDAPGIPYVVRRWEITAEDIEPREAWAAESLEAARTLIPDGLVMLSRMPDDDPAIVEVWV